MFQGELTPGSFICGLHYDSKFSNFSLGPQECYLYFVRVEAAGTRYICHFPAVFSLLKLIVSFPPFFFILSKAALSWMSLPDCIYCRCYQFDLSSWSLQSTCRHQNLLNINNIKKSMCWSQFRFPGNWLRQYCTWRKHVLYHCSTRSFPAKYTMLTHSVICLTIQLQTNFYLGLFYTMSVQSCALIRLILS